MLRVRTLVGGAGAVGGGLSTFFFPGAGAIDAAAAHGAVDAFWTALEPLIRTGVTLTTESEVAEITPSNGDITSIHSVPVQVATGSASSDQLPRATQGLVRWRTGVFFAGREVRGRTFIPAPCEQHADDGRPVAFYVTSVETAAAVLDGSLGVWRRPKVDPPTAGDIVPASGSSCWTEWAVLRSRRD